MDLHLVFARTSQHLQDTAYRVGRLVGPFGDLHHHFVALVRIAQAFFGDVEIDGYAVVVRHDESEMIRELQTAHELALCAGDDLHHLAFGPAAVLAAEHIYAHGVSVQASGRRSGRDVDIVGVFFFVLRHQIGGSGGGEVHRPHHVVRLGSGLVTSRFGLLQQLLPAQGVERLLYPLAFGVFRAGFDQARVYLLGIVDGRGVFVEYAQDRYLEFAQGVALILARSLPAGGSFGKVFRFSFVRFLQTASVFVFLPLHLHCFSSFVDVSFSGVGKKAGRRPGDFVLGRA